MRHVHLTVLAGAMLAALNGSDAAGGEIADRARGLALTLDAAGRVERVAVAGQRLALRGAGGIVLDQAIRIDIEAEDLTHRDRAIVVSFGLPIAAEGWTWWEGLRSRQTIEPGQAYFVRTSKSRFGADGKLSIYPLAALCHDRVGLAMTVPPDAPRDFVIQWGPVRGMVIRFFLGTSPDARKFPNRASASVLLYTCDPTWGFRDALKRYYDRT